MVEDRHERTSMSEQTVDPAPGAGPGHGIRRVGVVGLGTMGACSVEVFARNGLDVVGVEITAEAVERGRGHVEHSTTRAVARGKLAEADRDAMFARIAFGTSLEDVALEAGTD